MTIAHSKEEINNAYSALVALNLGPEFERGVTALNNAITRACWSTQTSRIVSAARTLISLEQGEFGLGVFALAGMLLDMSEMRGVLQDAVEYRRMAFGVSKKRNDGYSVLRGELIGEKSNGNYTARGHQNSCGQDGGTSIHT